jgi:hypothetical protein
MLYEQQSLHNFNNRDTFPRHSLALQASQAYIHRYVCIYICIDIEGQKTFGLAEHFGTATFRCEQDFYFQMSLFHLMSAVTHTHTHTHIHTHNTSDSYLSEAQAEFAVTCSGLSLDRVRDLYKFNVERLTEIQLQDYK